MPLAASITTPERLLMQLAGSSSPLQPSPVSEDTVQRHPQLAALQAGCPRARAAVLTEFEGIWFRFCLSLLADPDAARDATQETALRVLRRVHDFRGDASLRTWTLSIALNVCREIRRRRRWVSLPASLGLSQPGPGPAAKTQSREEIDRLHTWLSRLPARQREAVTLRYLQQLSTDQTMQVMGCASGTVKATLAKALRNLRKMMEAEHER
ncbi:MAG: RNA polymerase sigma factor [Planctomycetota bacterium]